MSCRTIIWILCAACVGSMLLSLSFRSMMRADQAKLAARCATLLEEKGTITTMFEAKSAQLVKALDDFSKASADAENYRKLLTDELETRSGYAATALELRRRMAAVSAVINGWSLRKSTTIGRLAAINDLRAAMKPEGSEE